jgi:hypothetical protein
MRHWASSVLADRVEAADLIGDGFNVGIQTMIALGSAYQRNVHTSTQVEPVNSDLLGNCFDCGLEAGCFGLTEEQCFRPPWRHDGALFLKRRGLGIKLEGTKC